MSAMPRRRGWCPSLYDPMETGDGLLVRVKPPGAWLTAPAARVLADAAAHWGNGVIELTRRGNLQVRGLRPDGVAPFAAAMAAAGLADPDPARERRRVVVAPPLAGDDPGAAATGLAERIEAALADGPALASKFCIAVDAGGVLAGRTVPADILVRTGGAEDRIIAGSLNATCAPDRTVAEVLRLAALANGQRLFPLSLREREPATLVIGIQSYPGTRRGALALGLPLGQMDAGILHALADLADRFSGAIRTSPFRALLLGSVPAADLPAAQQAAEAAGLASDPHDPRLLVTSCIGAPGCASATVPARQDAARLAREGRGPLHVSGCAKGCAYPGTGPALVGAAGQYTLVTNTLMPDWRPGLAANSPDPIP